MSEGAAWLALASARAIRRLCSPDIPSGEPHFRGQRTPQQVHVFPYNKIICADMPQSSLAYAFARHWLRIFSLRPILQNCFGQVMPILKY